MTNFKENASVIYTDPNGNKIDTFVIFDTDVVTGLTQINHENLRVSADDLILHEKTVCNFHMPLADAFSFEMISKLKEKYRKIDMQRKTLVLQPEKQNSKIYAFAEAS